MSAVTKHDRNLREEARRIIETEGYTQAAAAREAGISKGIFNQWVKGKYPGDNTRIESLVRRWLDSRRAKAELAQQLPSAPDWVETPTARTVQAALSYAQIAGAITCIYGGAGLGKTSAIRRYQQTAPNVWVLSATPALARPGPILYHLCQRIGVRTAGAPHMMQMYVTERVRDTRGLIVIDEAQHLCHRALDMVRSIHDETGIGIALAGNEIVYTQLTGGNRSIGFAQLFSRIAKRVKLGRPRDGDIDALLDAWALEDTEARRYCHAIARRPGALRGLSQTLAMATLFAAGEPLSVEHVRAAWADLGGE